MDDDSVDKDEFFTTLSKRTGKTSKVLQLRVVELRRAVQRAALRIQTKVSQCRMCDDQFVHCSVEK